MPVLFEHRDEFDERNAFLQVTLGLVSCARQVSGVLPRLEASSVAGAPEEPLDPVVCILLGLASMSRTILAQADAAASCSRRHDASQATPSPSTSRTRNLLEV